MKVNEKKRKTLLESKIKSTNIFVRILLQKMKRKGQSIKKKKMWKLTYKCSPGYKITCRRIDWRLFLKSMFQLNRFTTWYGQIAITSTWRSLQFWDRNSCKYQNNDQWTCFKRQALLSTESMFGCWWSLWFSLKL